MFIYRAVSHLTPIEDKYDTLNEAIQRALGDIELDDAAPIEIVDEAGAVILNRDELYDRAIALLERSSTPSSS